MLAAPALAQGPAQGQGQARVLSAEEAEQLYLRALQALAENDLPTAQDLLQRLMAGRPDHAGAWLDLAVLYCHLGDGRRANALWDEVEARFAPPRPIRELISLQRAQGCAPPVAQPGWLAQLQGARGHSSNVNQGVRDLHVGLNGPAGPVVLQLLPQYAPRGDGFTQLNASVRVPVADTKLEGFAQWQGRWHDAQHPFDVQDVALGLTRHWGLAGWQGRWQLGWGTTTLGGAVYQRYWQGQAWATPPWQPPAPWRWNLSAGLTRLNYPALPDFDARQWDARLHLEHASALQRLEAYASAAQDLGRAQRPGGDRDGWGLGLDWQRQLGTAWGQLVVARAGLDWMQWRSRAPYAPGFIDVRRVQRTWTGTAALVLPVQDDAAWVLELRQVRNDENIGLFAYDVRTLQISYQKRWGKRP